MMLHPKIYPTGTNRHGQRGHRSRRSSLDHNPNPNVQRIPFVIEFQVPLSQDGKTNLNDPNDPVGQYDQFDPNDLNDPNDANDPNDLLSPSHPALHTLHRALTRTPLGPRRRQTVTAVTAATPATAVADGHVANGLARTLERGRTGRRRHPDSWSVSARQNASWDEWTESQHQHYAQHAEYSQYEQHSRCSQQSQHSKCSQQPLTQPSKPYRQRSAQSIHPIHPINPINQVHPIKPIKPIKPNLFGNDHPITCLNAEAASGAASMGRNMLRDFTYATTATTTH